jgi:hypothetical protein
MEKKKAKGSAAQPKKKQTPTKTKQNEAPAKTDDDNHQSNGVSHPQENGNSKTNSKSTPVQNGKTNATKKKTNKKNVKTGNKKSQPIEKVSWLWPLLSGLAMVALPPMIFWCWVCVEFNQGKLLLPASLDADVLQAFFKDLYQKFIDYGLPNQRAVTIYGVWLVFQAILFKIGPGPIGYGLPLADGTRLQYKFNGQFAWFVTLIVAFSLHFTGYFRLTELYDQMAPLLTICHLVTFGLIAFLYIYAWVYAGFDRPTNSIIYDYFMGPIMNPRIFGFDIKFYFEIRPGIMHWFFSTVGLAFKQYELYGSVSTPMILICFYHLCFVNACYKGEHHIPPTMDIAYEKLGWMLLWLDIVVVPFIFPMQAHYLLKIAPFEHNPIVTVALALMHIIGYWIFDTANSQKDYFRAKPGEEIPNGFPNLPWSKLENPKYLPTERGTKLLLDGWWKYARHMNYLGDIMMAWAWGLTCGFGSIFPYVYAAGYLTPLLIHRERRDHADCKRKYGKDWDKYCAKVPYRIIPYVY